MNTDPDTINAIIEAVDGKVSKTRHDVIGLLGDDIAICRAWHRPPFEDAAFTGAIYRDGKWRETSHYSRSAVEAMLETIGHRFDGGGNSRFGIFAARMLQPTQPNP